MDERMGRAEAAGVVVVRGGKELRKPLTIDVVYLFSG